MMVSSVTSATTSKLDGLFGRLAHRDTGRLGSASMIVTTPPLAASSVPSRTAAVDLPAPPFGLAKTMVGISGFPCERLYRRDVILCTMCQQSTQLATSEQQTHC